MTTTHTAITRTYVGGFFSTCPTCDGHRYRTGSDVNRYSENYILFACDAGCEDGDIASLDIDVEWNESWSAEVDSTGRRALWVSQYEENEDDA